MRQQRQYGKTWRQVTGPPMCPGLVRARHHQTYRQGFDSGDTTQRTHWKSFGLPGSILPDRERSRVRMHTSPAVKYGVFIGVVGGAGTDQFHHKCAFSAEARSRDDDSPSPPAHYAGMHEDSVLCQCGRENLEIALHQGEGVVKSGRPGDSLQVSINKIQATNLGASPIAAGHENRIQPVHKRRSDRLPTRRDKIRHAIHDLRAIGPYPDAVSVAQKRKSCRPTQAVYFLHSTGLVAESRQVVAFCSGIFTTLHEGNPIQNRRTTGSTPLSNRQAAPDPLRHFESLREPSLTQPLVYHEGAKDAEKNPGLVEGGLGHCELAASALDVPWK